jgi:CRP/FNR family transcriptional regulator, anaerobic regulatory protein
MHGAEHRVRTLCIVPAAEPRRPQRRCEDGVPRCSSCYVRAVCLPRDAGHSTDGLDGFAYARKRVRRDQNLYHAGASFESLYAVRSGFLESRSTMADGREQVTGFHMPGDIVGADGMADGVYSTNVLALEDAELCVIPYARVHEHEVRRHIHKGMGVELARAQSLLLSLGSRCAEEGIAAFLVGFSQRMLALGYARDEFHMPMSRFSIGSYLGLKLETVCRMLTRLSNAGLIAVRHKRFRILDMPALCAIAATAPIPDERIDRQPRNTTISSPWGERASTP